MLRTLILTTALLNVCDASPFYGRGRRCFDASSTFTTRNGPKRMDAIVVGDEVLAARNDGTLVWDKIAADASHGGTTTMDYLSIATDTKHTLTLTANHYMHATRGEIESKSCCSADTLVTAAKVAVGDTVWVASGATAALTPTLVTAVTNVQRVGQYNFWLDQQDDSHFRSLIVNGVATVSFTEEFRLTKTLGFDVADRLVDPLRDMARLGIALPKIISREAPWLGLEVQDLVADCVESRMAGCSEEQIGEKLERILKTLEHDLGKDHADDLLRAFEELAARHLRSVPSSVRRLAAKFAAMHVTTLVAHEARSAAMHVCEKSDECKQGMVVNVQLQPSTGYLSGPLLVLTITLGVAVCALVLAVASLTWAVCRAVKILKRPASVTEAVADGAKAAPTDATEQV